MIEIKVDRTLDPYVTYTGNAILDLGGLAKQTKNALLRAIDTGVIESSSGLVADIYNVFRHRYGWPTPHQWAYRSYYSGVYIQEYDPSMADDIKSAMLLLAPDGYVPARNNDKSWSYHRSEPGHGYFGTHNKGSTNEKPTDVLLSLLKAHDPRSQRSIDAASEMVRLGMELHYPFSST